MPRLLIFEDYESLSRVAVEMLVFHARNALAQRETFTLVLSGGSTPQRLFEFLARAEYIEQISWPQTHVFWGDERCVPPDQPGSNYKQAYDAFLSKVPIPPANIHRIRGELPPETAAEDYTRQLHEFATPDRSSAVNTADLSGAVPRFDLVLLGLGNDGHTASLFPGPITEQELSASVIPVTAHYEDRPANRVSLTPRVFNAARQIFFLATGASKAETLHTILNAPLDPVLLQTNRFPAQRIQPTDGQVTWFVDRAAARLEQ
ncbi:MAG: 6-phosphogluconolactonase [Anaerolineales bacterium]|nr:6-phosphogluconolactonase [Anaerolineales bacterium]